MTDNDDPNVGQAAARLKWREGLTWPEVHARFPGEAPAAVRSAARRYRKNHPDEFPQADTPFDEFPQGLGVQFEEHGNTAEASSLSPQIKNPDELIEAAGIDMEVWEIDDFQIKTYDGWRANEQKRIVWEDGRIIDGYVESGGILTRTLWSVHVKFVRRELRPLEPTFSIVQCPVTYPAPPGPRDGGIVRSLLFSDLHLGFDKDLQNAKLRPFHDRLMLSVIIRVAQIYQPDYIGILGDLFDLARWTRRYAQEPAFYWTTQPAICEGFWLLRYLREICPDTRILFIEGNHDERMPRYVREHMIESYGLAPVSSRWPALSMPHLLDLDALQVEWIGGYADDEAKFRPAPWMVWEHGQVARTPGSTAKAVVDRAVRWRFFGHVHRCEVSSRSFEESEGDDRPPVSAVTFGCCCHVDGRVPGASPDDQWQQRFGIVEFDPEVVAPSVEIIPVRNGRAVWRGQEFAGQDYTDELRKAWPDWNW